MGNIVKFAKPYSFEGTEYTEVDLSGMDKLTIQDMIDIQAVVDLNDTPHWCRGYPVPGCQRQTA